MGRLLAAALALLLAAPAPAAAVAPPPSHEEIFTVLASDIDAFAAAIPDPPATKEEKKALKAWTAAGRAVEKALAKPSPKGFTKAAGKVEKILAKAFPEDAAVAALLDGLAADMVAAAGADLSEVLDLVSTLPDGEAKDALLDSLADIDAVLEGGYADRAAAHRMCAAAARALAAVEKKYHKALGKPSGKDVVAATVDGGAYTTGMVEGGIVKNGAGQARFLSVNGFRALGGGTVENLDITIDRQPTEEVIVPGTYVIDEANLVQVSFLQSGLAGLLEAVDCTSGSITITAISPADGSASGSFQGNGLDLGGAPFSITGGTFRATGLVVTTEEP